MSDSLGKILVVDDMDMVRDMLSDTLIESGYTVDVAVDGEDAFTKFEADGNVSLVISDMEMPVLDGIGFIKKLRAAKHEVPILLRVVRCLPSVAANQDAAKRSGQASDKPRGRKPRDVTGAR